MTNFTFPMRSLRACLSGSVLLLTLSTGSLFADSSVTVSELEKTSPTEGSLLLTLKTSETDATAFETELVYDPALVELTAPGSLQVPGTAEDEFSVDSHKVSEGHMHVVLSSARLKSLADGTSFRVPVRAAKGVSGIDAFFPVAVTDMELSNSQAKAAKPKLGTSLRIKKLQSGDKLNGKLGVKLDVEMVKDAAAQISKIEYLANGAVLKQVSTPGEFSWTPPGSGAFHLSARVTLKDGTSLQSKETPVIVTGLGTTPVRGAYAGVVQDSSDKKAASATGTVQIATSTSGTSGSYSIRLILNGTSLAAAGRFNSESIATPTILSRAGGVSKTYRLFFQQEATDSVDTISGVVTDGTLSTTGTPSGGSFSSHFVAARNLWATVPSGAATMAGKYTLAMPLKEEISDAPLAVSLLSLATSGLGVGRFSLWDGTRAVASGVVSKEGTWQPYASLYSKTGFLVGAVDFTDKGQTGNVGGSLDWRQNAAKVDALDVLGGKFSPPAKGTLFTVKSGTSNLAVSISGGSLAAAIKQSATLTATNLIQVPLPNPKKLSLRLDRSGGGLSGSFLAPGDTQLTPITGVILQGENRAVGYFLRKGERGFVEITPAP